MILTDHMLWRLIWKEYRAQRSFWLAIAGTAVGLMFLFIWLADVPSGKFTAPWVIAILLPGVFALGSSAVTFAAEKEEETVDLLRILAARVSRVFLGKIGTCLAGTVAMWGCLLIVARLMTWGEPMPVMSAGISFWDQFLTGIAFTVQITAWGFLFSLLCRKVLPALCLAAVVSILSIALTNETLTTIRPSETAYVHLLPTIPLLAVSFLLTSRMMSGLSWDLAWPRRTRLITPAISPDTVTQLDRLAAVRETAPLWKRTYARLVWLEFRQIVTVGHILWIAILLMFAWLPMESRLDAMRGLTGILFSALLMGVWMFDTEGGRRSRFLANHGLSPQVVWFCRQLVWGTLMVAVAVPFLVVVAIANHADVAQFRYAYSSVFHTNVPEASAVAFVSVLGCLSFAAGQFASMLIRRAVLAGFVGFVMTVLLGWWTWFLVELRIPLAISALPAFLILMGATLCWSRNWLLEEATFRSWARLTLAVAVSGGAVWCGMGLYRVFEVPHPDFLDGIASLRESQGRAITTDEAATTNLYNQALGQLKWDSAGPRKISEIWKISASSSWEQATPDERQWLAENQGALRICLSATERPTCAFSDPSRPTTEWEGAVPLQTEFTHLATLILMSARELESEGKLDEALDRYVATLRLSRHIASHGAIFHWSEGVLVETMVSEWIPVWAAHPEQTAERIEAGGRRIAREVAQFPPLRDALLAQQLMLRRTLLGDWSELLSRQDSAIDPGTRTVVNVIDRCCPWERIRLERVLDLFGASQLHSLELLEQDLRIPGSDMQQRAERAAAVPATAVHNRALLNRPHQSSAAQRTEQDDFFADQAAGPLVERIPWNWVRTTILFNSRAPADHSWIWQARLRRELLLRITQLRLRLAAFKKANGKYSDHSFYPDFGMDGIDPYTGTEFGFRPQGYQTPVRVVNGLTYVVERVESGQPILWSAGPGNVRLFVPMAAGEGAEKNPAGQVLNSRSLAFPLP